MLAGDHKQLPPTIKCPSRDVQRELGTTLFERLMLASEGQKEGQSCPSTMLEVQYRMHHQISDWASGAMYDGKLISHESVRDRKLVSLPLVMETAKAIEAEEDTVENVSLLLIDTTGCDMHETANEAGSRYNGGEASIVASHVKALMKLGLRAEDIAVITPYNGQVELLRQLLLPDVPRLEIRSVDGFQGGEREAVVLSLVRSSEGGGRDGVGFLRDARRLNVAVTRARRHCAVVCDCETVSRDPFIKGLVDWMEEKGEYQSGAQYAERDHVTGDSSSIAISTTAYAPQSAPKFKREGNVTTEVSRQRSNNEKIESKTKPKESNRVALMNKIQSFSESGKKGDELKLPALSDYDAVVARELADQLGLGCRDNGGANMLVLNVPKETKTEASEPARKEEIHEIPTSRFAKLDVDDDSSTSSNGNAEEDTPNDLLRQLALEREQRRSERQNAPGTQPPTPQTRKKKKKKKKKKGKDPKCGGTKPPPVEEDVDSNDIDDDMAFLDAQIEKVQTSHGRQVDAKGKGYRSVVSLFCVAISFMRPLLPSRVH